MPMTKSTVPENATHTPGPWTFEESTPGDGHHFIRGADGSYVVYPDDGWNSDYRDYATRLVNARLIAAAPDLLEAAQDALDVMVGLLGPKVFTIDTWRNLRDAVAKAEGTTR